MAKQKSNAQKPLSPEQYIKQKARTLPVARCYMSKDWQKAGLANVLVARRHPQGTFTFGYYLVDTYCLGLKDSNYRFSLSEGEFEDYMSHLLIEGFMQEVNYEEAHNLIYGAIAFAEEAGIEADKSFALTQYLLEEDTEEVPLVDYEFGRGGQHFLVANSRLEASRYLPLLEKNLGADFKYSIADEGMDEDLLDGFEDMIGYSQNLPDTEYTYQHPVYPDTLDLIHPEIYTLFADPRYTYGLPKEEIDRLLALPHADLRHDAERILLYEIGRTCDEISQEQWDAEYISVVVHSVFFLGEVGDADSLKVVLEALRQREEFYEFHVGDSGEEVFVPTLYLLGKDRLDLLMDYVKEPGMYTFARVKVFPAVALVARRDASRREEVIEWFRGVLKFYTEQLPETAYCDGCLVGMMIAELMDIKAKELLPEIEAIFATECVDVSCAGDFKDVKEDILMKSSARAEEYLTDIYQRYQEYQKRWG